MYMFILPDLPYAYNSLEPMIDERTMQIHHDKHHAAYVKNLNDALVDYKQFDKLTIEQLLGRLDELPEAVRAKVRNNGGGHANHSLFWTVMTKSGSGGQPDGKLKTAISTVFGDLSKLQEQMNAAAMGRFGSGWAWLVVDGGSLVIMDTLNQDSPIMTGKKPILGVDVWEHAYYLKYQNMRADYLKAWWQVVNWEEVGRLYGDW